MINVEPDAVPDTRNASFVGGFPIPTFPVKVEVLDALIVVKAPVVGVVAPTVPLMLMDAVPVRFVTTPEEGVPNAGVTNVGEFDKTTDPVPVEVVTPVPPFATSKVPLIECVAFQLLGTTCPAATAAGSSEIAETNGCVIVTATADYLVLGDADKGVCGVGGWKLDNKASGGNRLGTAECQNTNSPVARAGVVDQSAIRTKTGRRPSRVVAEISEGSGAR